MTSLNYSQNFLNLNWQKDEAIVAIAQLYNLCFRSFPHPTKKPSLLSTTPVRESNRKILNALIVCCRNKRTSEPRPLHQRCSCDHPHSSKVFGRAAAATRKQPTDPSTSHSRFTNEKIVHERIEPVFNYGKNKKKNGTYSQVGICGHNNKKEYDVENERKSIAHHVTRK